MSHVDEGTLHAYFDGELPPSERRDLELHIAQCATCTARLGEERALFERAGALLGVTRPAERPAPPFEQVRRAPRRPWYMRTSFAWAASLVLAIGFGYYLGGTSNRLAPSALLFEQRAATPPATESRQPQELDARVPPAALARRQQRDVAQAQLGALADTDRRLNYFYNESQPTVALRGAKPAQAPADARALDTILGRRDSGAASVALEAVIVDASPARAERRAAATGAAAPSASRNDPQAVRNLTSTTWPLISRGKAASLLGDRPVGVPGLATRRIRQSPGTDSTVVVEQALDSNTVIQIFQRPASAVAIADSLELKLYSSLGRERADRVLARYVGRLRVEISGPVSTDSLNKLLEQVEPLP